jgi:hypothetical protein
MPRVGFEPTIPASERTKTVQALDHLATVTGLCAVAGLEIKILMFSTTTSEMPSDRQNRICNPYSMPDKLPMRQA